MVLFCSCVLMPTPPKRCTIPGKVCLLSGTTSQNLTLMPFEEFIDRYFRRGQQEVADLAARGLDGKAMQRSRSVGWNILQRLIRPWRVLPVFTECRIAT